MRVDFFDVKAGDIERLEQSLNVLCRVLVPAREAWALAKAQRIVRENAEQFRAERVKILTELGKSKDGISYDIAPENMPEFHKKMNDLLEMGLEIPLPAVEFKHFEKAQLSAETLEPLIGKMFPDMEGNEL